MTAHTSKKKAIKTTTLANKNTSSVLTMKIKNHASKSLISKQKIIIICIQDKLNGPRSMATST